MKYTIILLAIAALLLVFLIRSDRKNNPTVPLSTTIRQWPWTDTLLGIAVLLSGWTILFYEGCLVFMDITSYKEFAEAMQPVFTFLNIMLGTAGVTVVGRRATTKTELMNGTNS